MYVTCLKLPCLFIFKFPFSSFICKLLFQATFETLPYWVTCLPSQVTFLSYLFKLHWAIVLRHRVKLLFQVAFVSFLVKLPFQFNLQATCLRYLVKFLVTCSSYFFKLPFLSYSFKFFYNVTVLSYMFKLHFEVPYLFTLPF